MLVQMGGEFLDQQYISCGKCKATVTERGWLLAAERGDVQNGWVAEYLFARRSTMAFLYNGLKFSFQRGLV